MVVTSVLTEDSDSFKLMSAALNALAIVQCGIQVPTLQAHTTSYNRYFQPDQLLAIQQTYQRIIGDGWGSPQMPNLLQIRYQYDDTPTHAWCDNQPYFAYLKGNQENGAAILTVCPLAFAFPRPRSLAQALGRGNECVNIAGSASFHMQAPAAQILHEFFHWRFCE